MALALPLRALAPAKLNLFLHIGRRREDGLHEICSLFCPITLADVLTVDRAAGAVDVVVCPGVPEPNLAAVALVRFRERFAPDLPPLQVSIDKRIPVAAGLGGGSADAGATLRLVLASSGLEPSDEELGELALSIGADVPSQLRPGMQLVTGAGERVEPLAAPSPLPLVLLTAGSLSTARVYARAEGMGLTERDLTEIADRLRAAVAKLRGPGEIAPLVHNDLQRAALALAPATQSALVLLDEAGAQAAAVSGSGPTAFGLFGDGGEAAAARRRLEDEWDRETILAASAPDGYGDPEPA
jgi:4-diphosphocytidyl-2-C-methyl-D-erythritol kinase